MNIPFTRLLSRWTMFPGTLQTNSFSTAVTARVRISRRPRSAPRGRKQIVYLRGHWAAWQEAGLRVER